MIFSVNLYNLLHYACIALCVGLIWYWTQQAKYGK